MNVKNNFEKQNHKSSWYHRVPRSFFKYPVLVFSFYFGVGYLVTGVLHYRVWKHSNQVETLFTNLGFTDIRPTPIIALVLFGAIFIALAFQNSMVRINSVIVKPIAGQFRELVSLNLQRFNRRSRYAILMISIAVASVVLIGMWQGSEVEAAAVRTRHAEGSDIIIRSQETSLAQSWLNYSLIDNLTNIRGVEGATPGYTSQTCRIHCTEP